jgi:hypothetical protein
VKTKTVILVSVLGVSMLIHAQSVAQSAQDSVSQACNRGIVRLLEPLRIVDGHTLVFSSDDFAFLRDASLKGFTLEVAVPSFLPGEGRKRGRGKPSLNLAKSNSDIVRDFEVRMRQSPLTGELRMEFNVRRNQAIKRHLLKEILAASELSTQIELSIDSGNWNFTRAVLEIRASAGSCAN